MADNVTLPGTGEIVATDEVAGKQFQRVKVTVGGDGVDGGDVSASNPLPVLISDGSGPVTVDGTVTISDGSGPVTVDGTVAVSGTVPVSGPVTDAEIRATPLPVSGTVAVSGPSGATTANVAAAITTNTVLAANAARRGATVWNDSTAILYLRFGTFGASPTTATVKLVADAYFEVPFGYTGAIQGIWAAANGAARVTELT
jgi:hypothetical protein